MTELDHIPVLASEVIELIVTDRSGRYLDGTCGLGGHAALILNELSEDGRLICLDRDVNMLQVAENRLRDFSGRVDFHSASYDEADTIPGLDPGTIAGILLDLGICSAQLDDDSRGFSFRFEAPLDMRFDQNSATTARDYLNNVSQEDLSAVFRDYGDFRNHKQLAARVIRRRGECPLLTVGDVVACVEDLFPKGRINKYTARLLQCVRIAVNDELQRLDRALPMLVGLLRPGGRLGVISYHSQEDRRVKRFIRQSSRDSGLPPEIEVCMKGKSTDRTLSSVTRKAVKAAADEVRRNPRARSARLRVAEKLSAT